MMAVTKKCFVAVIFMMSIMTMMTVFAESRTDINLSLPANQQWTTAATLSRSGNYNNVYAKCSSVYPETGSDNFSKVQVRITNSSGTLIMNTTYTTLTEGNGYSSIAIKQGYLNTSSVRFDFRGNSSKAANAVVSCNAR